MKKWSVLPAAIVVFAAATIFYVSPNRKIEEPRTQPVKLGAIVPITGGLGWFGENARDAGLLLEEDIKAQRNGRRLQINFYDSKSNPKDGLAAYHQMRLDNISIFYVFADPIAKTIQPVASEEKTLMFVGSVDNDISAISPYLFRLYYGFKQQNELQLALISSLKPQKVAMLLGDVPHIRKYAEERLGNALKSDGINVLTVAFDPNTTKDFKDILAKILDFKPDIVLMSEYGMLYPTIFRQFRELSRKLPTVICGIEMMNMRPEDYPLYEGVYFTAPAYLGYQDDPFAKRFKERFGKFPSYEAYYAYDSLNLLFIAASNNNTIDTMRDWILRSHVSGISQPEIIFSKDGDLNVAVQLFQFNNSKIVPIAFKEKQ